ncbi:bacillolysin [Intrasporangium oryzae NRRL B-24470]|uniref:Neutral metalloproteinase n=1 Tax=Intrasporangium oryzae NRRL B-24470 TaxID=1386089 RepID=W9G527_9MICO|nr:M4 family metallopeptidase [Intrasporangium oryzae]EWT01256.1 bacillolysin [Intrasporangium oryzae NRRL B-24470]
MSRRLIAGAVAATAAFAMAGAPAIAASASTPATTSAGAKKPEPAGSFALSGADAAAFRMPPGMTKVRSWKDADGNTLTRYQQKVGNATVIGGQVTVVSDTAGVQTAVVGAYLPGLRARNAVKLTTADARGKAKADLAARSLKGDAAARAKEIKTDTTLRFDPKTDRYVYVVDTVAQGERPVRWVDAGSGAIVKSVNALTEGTGEGVKGDTKSVDSTQRADGTWVMISADGRKQTYDFRNTTSSVVRAIDDNDVWDTKAPLFASPDQRPLVDAHYYADVVDDFYRDTFKRNSIDNEGLVIRSLAHYAKNYCNAFWNGVYMTYGDGNGTSCLPLSGGLDVISHELTHGVTEYTSGLIYENEPGALNEAFSDMMGNTAEFYAEDTGRDPSVTPDWRIGEDVIVTSHGFRNMGNPGEFDDPDHYSLRYTGDLDNGGVHTNSGIANHAYFLAVKGGYNRGCATAGNPTPTHTADCDVSVPKLGLGQAKKIFYNGFTALPEYANFCDARNSTIAVAGRYAANMGKVWDAVGVKAGCAPGTPPPPPCVGDANATIPFGTQNGYGNDGDCTWTYDNGTAGFRFRFSVLSTELDFDYVYVKDANGNVLATYTGSYPAGTLSPCIPTSVGSVQLVSDPGVKDKGFVVDATEAC